MHKDNTNNNSMRMEIKSIKKKRENKIKLNAAKINRGEKNEDGSIISFQLRLRTTQRAWTVIVLEWMRKLASAAQSPLCLSGRR